MLPKTFAIYANRGPGFEERWIALPYRVQALDPVQALAALWQNKQFNKERDLAVLPISAESSTETQQPRVGDTEPTF
jgi:hypothetical protein